jgi:hypothetical protein
MQALHGGKATNDTSASQNIAVLLRGGMRPHAYGSPAEMRATRARLRRRLPLTRKRAELLAHVQHTNRQDTLPEIGTKIAEKAHREGVAERVPAPAVQQSVDVDLALLDEDAQRLRDIPLTIRQTAKQHAAQTL